MKRKMSEKYYILKKKVFLKWSWYVKVPDTFHIDGEKTIEGIKYKNTGFMIIREMY